MRILLAIAAVSCSAPALPPGAPPAPAGLAYPVARPGDVVETHHGVAVADPYRWLEDMDSAETRRWVTAQNTVTDAYLARLPGREALRRRITELVSYEQYGPPVHRGGRYFWTRSDGKQNQRVVWTAPALDAAPTVLLDPNAISNDGSLAFAGLSFDQAGTRAAYGLAIGGGDWQRWYLRDVATLKDSPEVLEHIKYYAPVFTGDGAGLYYSRFPAPQPGKELTETDHDCKVYFHRVGTPTSEDVVVYERPDHPTWQFELTVTRDGRYLVITTGDGQVGDRSEEAITYLDIADRKPVALPLIEGLDADYSFLGNERSTFYFITNLDAPTKRIIAIDADDRDHDRKRWNTVVPAGPQAIEYAKLVGHQLLVVTMKDAHHAVTAYDLRGKKLRDVALPGLGSAYGFGGDPEDRDTYYWFTGYTTPGSIYRYDLATGDSSLWKAPQVPFDPSSLETRQVFFASKDGTKVPMFVVAKKGLPADGSNPTMITGYGFGGVSLTPSFDSTMIAWLERGGAYAVVNIRGGGEYGEAWHLAARRTHRQVGLDDFIAAGEWLVASKLTSPAHLGAIGTSGGGMLVAAVLDQRPDLFGAVVPIAGVHDLLRFQLFGQGAGWQGDFGSPDDAAEFAVLRAVSPLHNVRRGTRYPATFVITSDHDVRVPPLHSYKLAAALQAAQAAAQPVIMRVQTESGHGGGSTRSQEIEQTTEIFSFLAANLGLRVP